MSQLWRRVRLVSREIEKRLCSTSYDPRDVLRLASSQAAASADIYSIMHHNFGDRTCSGHVNGKRELLLVSGVVIAAAISCKGDDAR